MCTELLAVCSQRDIDIAAGSRALRRLLAASSTGSAGAGAGGGVVLPHGVLRAVLKLKVLQDPLGAVGVLPAVVALEQCEQRRHGSAADAALEGHGGAPLLSLDPVVVSCAQAYQRQRAPRAAAGFGGSERRSRGRSVHDSDWHVLGTHTPASPARSAPPDGGGGGAAATADSGSGGGGGGGGGSGGGGAAADGGGGGGMSGAASGAGAAAAAPASPSAAARGGLGGDDGGEEGWAPLRWADSAEAAAERALPWLTVGERLLRHMLSIGERPTLVAYSSLINGFAQAGETAREKALFQEMLLLLSRPGEH